MHRYPFSWTQGHTTDYALSLPPQSMDDSGGASHPQEHYITRAKQEHRRHYPVVAGVAAGADATLHGQSSLGPETRPGLPRDCWAQMKRRSTRSPQRGGHHRSGGAEGVDPWVHALQLLLVRLGRRDPPQSNLGPAGTHQQLLKSGVPRGRFEEAAGAPDARVTQVDVA